MKIKIGDKELHLIPLHNDGTSILSLKKIGSHDLVESIDGGIETNCTNCKYFGSFYDSYDNDPLEPTDLGYCHFGGQYRAEGKPYDTNFGEHIWCSDYESIENKDV